MFHHVPINSRTAKSLVSIGTPSMFEGFGQQNALPQYEKRLWSRDGKETNQATKDPPASQGSPEDPDCQPAGSGTGRLSRSLGSKLRYKLHHLLSDRSLDEIAWNPPSQFHASPP